MAEATGSVAIADYGIGNIGSLVGACRRLGVPVSVSADPEQLARATLLLLPGVGHFGACARALRDAQLDEVVRARVREDRPLLGICVGMQLLFEGSEESPEPGLGVFPGVAARMAPSERLPEMQWNLLELTSPRHPIVAGLADEPWVYFVHSFAVRESDAAIAWEEYGGRYVAAVAEGRVAGVQFHPEKSSRVGAEVLRGMCRVAGVLP